jgi:predicted amidohydrolase
MKSKIGVVQMNSSDRLVDNVAFAKAQIEQAADQGIDLVSFPETFVYVGQPS